jgi:flagellar biosynthesis/type III secretory pathway M-ring protein FliF/YscJ
MLTPGVNNKRCAGDKSMNLVLAGNALPVAGAWMLAYMIVLAILLLPIFPFILRRRRKREHALMKEKAEKAKANILEDGIVEGPKGPYVRHIPWGIGSEIRTPREGPPRAQSYHGGPWPKA